MEETPEQLKVRIAELEKQLHGKRSGNRWRKGRSQRIRVRPLPGDVVLRAVD